MTGQYLPLGCFGKLPCYGDFLEGSVYQPSSRALKEWVFGGREALGLENEGAEAAKPRETVRRRFLYGLPGSVELVAGVIRPSADQGQRREFPFMVFTHFPRRPYARGSYALLPMALAPVWDALDDAWDSLANVATRAAFEEVVRSTRVPAPEPAAATESAYRGLQQEAANRIFDGNDASLDELFANLPEVVAEIRKAGGADAVRLELPVSAGGPAASFDTSFWIDLLNRQFLWRRLEPQVFQEESGSKKTRRTMLIFGILQTIDYASIMGCEGTQARVYRPAGTVLADGPPRTPPDRCVTYAELLARRLGAGG